MNTFSTEDLKTIARHLIREHLIYLHKGTRAILALPTDCNAKWTKEQQQNLLLVQENEKDYLKIALPGEEFYENLFNRFLSGYVEADVADYLRDGLQSYIDTGDYGCYKMALSEMNCREEWEQYELACFLYYVRLAVRPYDLSYIQYS